ncbi:ABC transporter permease [Streptosporangium sp. NBC_01756]|uniref:ABC transporter permease n=1 Tax=Streptosporangium sp. NBC_01756 TaxID=2975950 RepID=UPI002DD92A77|nr:ABC transporter permease [Streptosporangium sp. NBC_01756]WSC83891.1 ABC transporter permease [Streptosporangium sp. NBC_01756]
MIRTSLALSRIGGLAAVFFAVLGGMALVVATGVIAESGLRSRVAAQRLVHADVMVSARQSLPRKEDLPVALPERAVLPASLITRLTGFPGVAETTGDVSFPAAVVRSSDVPAAEGDPATAGHGWSSLALAGSLRAGRAPRGSGEVALPRGRLGQEVRLVAGGRSGVYRVTALVDAPGLYFPDTAAADLAGRTSGPRANTVDLVALRLDPGADIEAVAAELRTLLGERYEVATGFLLGDAESPGMAAARGLLIVLSGSIGGISLLVVGFVVGGSLSLSINRQRRDLALLRAAGATPRQVRRLIAIQAAVAGAAALPLGIVFGYHLAGRFGGLLVSAGALPATLPLVYSPLPTAAAALLLAAVVRGSAWASSLRASRVPVPAALAESRSEPREPSKARTAVGMLLLPASLVLSIVPLLVRTEAAVIGPANAALLAVIGLALAGPHLVRTAAGALADHLPARTSAAAWLAVNNTRGYALRTAGAVAAMGMVVTLGLSFTLTQTTIMTSKADEAALGMRGVRAITADRLGGVPHGLESEVRATPGVRAAASIATTTVLTRQFAFGDDAGLQDRTALVLGPDASAVIDLDVAHGSLSDLRGAAIAVDERVGAVGESRALVMGDGVAVRARVVATYRRALGFGPLIVSRDLADGHTTTGLAAAILVRPAASGAPDFAALLARWPGVEMSATPLIMRSGGFPAEVVVNLAVLVVLLGYVLVMVANRLVATTTARREEFRALLRLGATPGQLRRMLSWEAVLTAGAAAGAGVVLAAVPLTTLSVSFLGRPWPAGSWWLVPVCVLLVGAVAWPATVLPARRVCVGDG